MPLAGLKFRNADYNSCIFLFIVVWKKANKWSQNSQENPQKGRRATFPQKGNCVVNIFITEVSLTFLLQPITYTHFWEQIHVSLPSDCCWFLMVIWQPDGEEDPLTFMFPVVGGSPWEKLRDAAAVALRKGTPTALNCFCSSTLTTSPLGVHQMPQVRRAPLVPSSAGPGFLPPSFQLQVGGEVLQRLPASWLPLPPWGSQAALVPQPAPRCGCKCRKSLWKEFPGPPFLLQGAVILAILLNSMPLR